MYPLNGRVSILVESDLLYSSRLPPEFAILSAEAYHDLGNSNSIYVIQPPPFAGLMGDRSLPSQASDLVSQNLDILIPSNGKNPHLTFLVAFVDRSIHGRGFNGIEGGRIPVSPGRWKGRLYITPDVHDNYGFVPMIRTTVDTSLDAIADPRIFTDDLRIDGGRFGSFPFLTPSPDIHFARDGATMCFGGAPIYPDMRFEITPQKIAVDPILFRGSLNEVRYYDPVFTDFAIYNDRDESIASGKVLDFQASRCGPRGAPCISIPVNPGIHRLEFINTGYFSGSIRGRGRFSARFDTRAEDRTPPIVTSLKLLNSEGAQVERLEAGESGTLEFSASDERFFDEDGNLQYRSIVSTATRLYVRLSLAAQWEEVEVIEILEDRDAIHQSGHYPIGFLYRALLSGLTQLESGSVDLRIELLDQGGNSAEWVFGTGFYHRR
jgi:hypothetical protein